MKEKNISVIPRRDFIRRACCAAVGTVAMTSAINKLRLMNAVMAQSSVSDYKALVCIFLQGGDDSNNLIIPTALSEYNNYAAVRTSVLALPRTSLMNLQIPGTGGGYNNLLPENSINTDYTDAAGHNYGFHPACPQLAQLFYEGKLAMQMNVGTLVYPITRAQYQARSISTPPQLFSHADQVSQWQTSVPDQPALTGWSGRCADLMNSVNTNSPVSMSISLAGANTLEVGNIVSQYSVSTSGAIQLQGVSGPRLAALTNMLGLQYLNMQAQAYAGVAAHSINSGVILNNAINATTNANFWNYGFTNTIATPNGVGTFSSTLMPQLKMVARLIEAGSTAAAAGGFGMSRQIFFCQVGGYDLHTGQTGIPSAPTDTRVGAHANLLAELSQSLLTFQRAMEQLGLANKVTAFTASDFSRTFPSNGSGSDHGWGSHQIIVGGSGFVPGQQVQTCSVNGGQTFGKLPTLTVNGPDDTGTGRWIPTTATDQYFATLATWFGVDPGNLATVFPNLSRFSSNNLGFMNPS
jgi:uncharacterized protein (DUF1501 family)